MPKSSMKRAKTPDRSLGRVRRRPSQSPHISFHPETEDNRNIISHGTLADRHYSDGTTARGRINSMLPQTRLDRNNIRIFEKEHPFAEQIENAAVRRERERCERNKKSCTGKFCDMMTCGLTKKYTWGGKRRNRKTKRKRKRKTKHKRKTKRRRVSRNKKGGASVSFLEVWREPEDASGPQGKDISAVALWKGAFNEWAATNLDASDYSAINTTFIANMMNATEKVSSGIRTHKPTFYYKVGNQWKSVGLKCQVNLNSS